jgi:nucleotide-binding universal stress UspA family protein
MMTTKTVPATKSRSRISKRAQSSKENREALQIRNVLVPMDFSAPSLSALEFAIPLIKQFAANLHLVHVFAHDYPITALVAMPLVLPELEINKSVHRHLKDIAKSRIPFLHLNSARDRALSRIDWRLSSLLLKALGRGGCALGTDHKVPTVA